MAVLDKQLLIAASEFSFKKIKKKSFTRKQPFLGDVFLLMEENTPRGERPLGLVKKLKKDPDGNIRSVELKTAKPKITGSIC